MVASEGHVPLLVDGGRQRSVQTHARKVTDGLQVWPPGHAPAHVGYVPQENSTHPHCGAVLQ